MYYALLEKHSKDDAITITDLWIKKKILNFNTTDQHKELLMFLNKLYSSKFENVDMKNHDLSRKTI